MEKQSSKLDQAMKVSSIIGILIIALSIAYYIMVFLPQKERVRIEQLKQEQSAKDQKEQAQNEEKKQQELSLQNCLNKAEAGYKEDVRYWLNFNNTTCAQQTNVSISSRCYDDVLSETEKAKKNYEQEKEDCFKLYPQT